MCRRNEEHPDEETRRHRFSHIEFRDTPLGRMAYVEETRSGVWLVCDLARQNGGDVSKTAALHEWPEMNVQAALDYARAYPEEIEALITRAHGMTQEKLRRLNAA